MAGFIYFIIIINLFDTFYTAYSLNQTSLFSEMFQNLKQRAKANQYVAIFNIIGLLLAVLLPALMVSSLLGPETYNLAERLQLQMEFIIAAIVMAVLAAVFAAIFILRGIRERKEYSKDPESAPSFVDSLKYTFKNKAVRTYVVTNFAQWYLFGIIPIINPYFFTFILGIDDAFIQNIFLAIIFISAICFMIIWRNYFSKHGAKKGHGAALLVTIITLIPFTFIWEIVGAIITYILLGFGFAGIMFGRDVIFSAIIDKDEIDTGVRREGGYYGINALIIRFSTIAVALSLLIVFPTVGWLTWTPTADPTIVNLGIRLLMFGFPAIALGLGILSILRFPINQEKYFEIREKLEEIHSEKLRKVSGE